MLHTPWKNHVLTSIRPAAVVTHKGDNDPSFLHAWWRHQMETFFALLALCAGNSPVPVNSPHKGQWRGVLMFSLIYVWINGWVNNREAGDLRRHRSHYDVNVMYTVYCNMCEKFQVQSLPQDGIPFDMIFFFPTGLRWKWGKSHQGQRRWLWSKIRNLHQETRLCTKKSKVSFRYCYFTQSGGDEGMWLCFVSELDYVYYSSLFFKKFIDLFGA